MQDKLHRAQDAVNEKQEQVDTLQKLITKAKQTLQTDTEKQADAASVLQDAHKRHGGDAEALEKAMSEARKITDDLNGRVQNGETRIADLTQGMGYAQAELKELCKVRDRARLHVVRGLKLATEPPKRLGDRFSLTDVADLNMEDMIPAFSIQTEFSQLGPNPFEGTGASPLRFFQFIAQYFAQPTRDEAAIMHTRAQAMIWGDYDVPLKGRDRDSGQAHNPVNLDLIGTS